MQQIVIFAISNNNVDINNVLRNLRSTIVIKRKINGCKSRLPALIIK